MKKYYSVVNTIVHYLFYALFLFTPLVMNSHTSEIFEFNKMMLVYTGAVLIGSLWLVRYYLDPHRTIYKPYLLIVLFLFLITQLISAYFSIDQHTSFFGYYGRWNGGILSIIAYIVLFFVFTQVFTRRDLPRFLFISLLSSSLVIAWGLFAKIGYDASCLLFTGVLTNTCWTEQFKPAERMFATIGQPNWLGAYLSIHFFIGVYFVVKEYVKDRWNSLPIYGFSTYVILNALCIFFTKSRSALLALGIALIFGVALVVARRIKPIYSLLTLVTFGCILFFFNPLQIVTQVHSPAPDNLNVTESFDIRKIVWQGAFELGARYPYFGTGVETFAYAYYFTRPIEHNRTSEWDFIYNKAHNEYLNYLATTGWIGLSAYLLVIFVTCILFYLFYKKTYKKNLLSVAAYPTFYVFLAYITILITNFFGFSTSTTQLFFYSIPGILLLDADMNQQEDHQDREEKDPTVFDKAMISIALIICVFGLQYIYSYYQADLKYSVAKNAIASSDYGNAMVELHDALKLREEHVYEDKLSSTLAYLAFQYSFDDKPRAKDFVDLSKYSNYKSLTAAPYNMLYWKTQARNNYLFYQMSQDEKDMNAAITSMEKALELAPTDVQTMYALAVLYVTASKEAKDPAISLEWKAKAKRTLNHIFKLKPDYREAQQLGGEV